MEEKKFKTESFMSVKELVNFLNSRRLRKEEIINVIPMDEFLFLIYLD